jgi:hypothetical protein
MIGLLPFSFIVPMMHRSRLFILFAAAAAMSVGFAACDQKPKKLGWQPPDQKKAGPSVDTRYKVARQLLLEGKFADAAAAFHELGTEPKIRQPLFNWITTLEGMTLLLDGREPESRNVFAQVVARGPFSEKEQEVQMAKFFVDVSQLLSGEAVIPAVAAKDYDKWTFEGLAFLLFALKDWNLDNFEEAVPLFRQFASVAPERMVEWAEGPDDLNRLKQISENCVNDYLEYRPANEALTAATSIEDQAKALDKAKESRGKMKLTTKLSKALDAKIAELSPKVAAVMAEKAAASAAEQAFDDKALPEAKKKRSDLLAKYQFEQAKQAILDPTFKTEKSKDEQTVLSKKASWLANFKSQLIEDLNAKGYSKPIKSKQGSPSAGPVAKADDQNLMINSPTGLVPMPWTELSPESAFEMAKSYISEDLPPAIAAFRKWHLGVFASYAGKNAESKTLLEEAAQARAIFAEELPVFAQPVSPEAW